jgi:uncharacterized repeat protein (TIGR03847 family)
MTQFTYDFEYVHRITAGAVGEPGQRVFYVQARKGIDILTLRAEKEHVDALAKAVEHLLDNLGEKDPKLVTTDDMLVTDMQLEDPLETTFYVSQMGLGYDEERDRVVLVVQGQTDALTEDVILARVSATRPQMRALSVHANRVVAAGRPFCLQYPRPCDFRKTQDETTCPFCPGRN